MDQNGHFYGLTPPANWLDAAGNVLGSFRIGSDSSVIMQNLSTYDAAGNLLSSVNALGQTNLFTWGFDSAGQYVTTNTRPDGSTVIENHAMDGALTARTGTGGFPVRYDYGTESAGVDGFGSSVTCAYQQEIKLDTSGTDTSEWVKTYTDAAGRTWKTAYPDASASTTFFNNQGQVSQQADADGVTTLYQYNGKGERVFTATDMNTNGTIDFGGLDRVTFTTNDVVVDNGSNVRRTRTYVWAANNVDSSNLVSTVETSVDGLRSWNTIWNYSGPVTSQSQTVYAPAQGLRTTTQTAPDGSYTTTITQYGQLASVTRYDANGLQIGQTRYGYDAHGRQNTVTDARNGATTYFFNDADQISTVVAPSVSGAQPTTNYFDTMGRIWKSTLSDGASVTNLFYPTGLLQETCGSRTYPVQYTYDYAGRMKTMTTWTNFALNAGAAVTTWNYDIYRGFLTNKTYDGGAAGPSYAYTRGGRLQTRLWARGIATIYSYSAAGDLQAVSYSDSTPGVTFSYDRLGRQASVICNGMTNSLAYDVANSVLSEMYSGGPLDGLSLTNGYDQFLRRTNFIWAINNQLSAINYSYDAASRLRTVSQGTNSATYGYVANSPLVGQILFTNGSAWRMTTTKQYDSLNRLAEISSVPSGSAPVSFNYTYNAANQRVQTVQADGSQWRYAYDSLGQVTSGRKLWSDLTPVAGEQFGYRFDDIGNRISTQAGGDGSGANLRFANYVANHLNQYTSRAVPGAVDLTGVALGTNTVTVAGLSPYRKAEYFREQVAVDNSVAAVWTNITVSSPAQSSVTGNAFVPQDPELFGYDADGNLTNDGHFAYTWDAENRLVAVAVNTLVGPQISIKFDYDSKSRRIRKQVWSNTVWSGSPTNDVRFVYDGWNLVGILNSSFVLQDSFTWGLDLNGAQQGAGGVGGLLFVYDLASGVWSCPALDGNGNVSALIKAADGTVSARYEYGPFGEVIRATGPMARANPFRFSTKYQDDESDLLYYGYRYYNASTGRWLSRDPIDELGFRAVRRSNAKRGMADPNLYGFVLNDPLQHVDAEGLASITITYQNGTTVNFGDPNFNQLVNALTNAMGTSNLIVGITIKGHACCTMQSFGDDFITVNPSGNQIIGPDGTDIVGDLKGALAPGAWIYLAGCSSGRGAGNIAQQMSSLLPNITVSGHQGHFALNVPYCACALGKRNYYINGNLVNSAW